MASVDGATISGKNTPKTNVFWRTVPQDEQFRNVLVPGVASGILKGNNNDSRLHSQGQTIKKSKSDSAVPSRRDDFFTSGKGARKTTKTTQKIAEKDISSAKNTNVLKGTGQVGSMINLSGSESSRNSSIKNLNVEDKKRVANLIKELAKTGEERELALERLQEERVSFEDRLTVVQEEQASLRLERESLRKKLENGQELLKKYETELKNAKLLKEKQDKILKKQSVAMAQGTQTSPLIQRITQGTESKSVRAVQQVPVYSNSLFDLKMSKVEFGKSEDGVEEREHGDELSKGDVGLHELYLREYKLQLHLQEQQLEIQRQQVLLQQHLQVLQQQQQQQQQQQPQHIQQQQQQHQQQQQPQHVPHRQVQQQQQQQQHQQQRQQQPQHIQQHQEEQQQQTQETSIQQTNLQQQRPNKTQSGEFVKTRERLPDHYPQRQSLQNNRLQHTVEHGFHEKSDKIDQHGSQYTHLDNQPRNHLSHTPQAMDGLPSQQDHHHSGAKHGNSSQPSQKTKAFERSIQYNNSIGRDDMTDGDHKSFEKHGDPRRHSTEPHQPVEQRQVYHTRPHSHLTEHHSPEQHHHSMEKRGAHSMEKRGAREQHYHSNLDHPKQSEPRSSEAKQSHSHPDCHSEQNGSRRNHLHQTDHHHFNAEHFPSKPSGPQSKSPEPFSNIDYCQECLGNSKFFGEPYAYNEHSCYTKQNISPSEQQFFVEQPKTVVGEDYHQVAEHPHSSDSHTLQPSQHHWEFTYHTPKHQLMREQPFEPTTQYTDQVNSRHHQLPENRDHLKHGEGSYGMDVVANASGYVRQKRQVHSHSNQEGNPRQPQINDGYSNTEAPLDEYVSNHHIPTEYDHHNAGYSLYKPGISQRSHERPYSRQKPSTPLDHSQSSSNNYPHSLIEIVENIESNSEYEETYSNSHLNSDVVSVSSEEEENEVLDNIFFLKR